MEMEDDGKVKTTMRKVKDGHGAVIGERNESGDGFRHVVETFLEKFTHRQTVIIEKWNKVETTRREIMETVAEAWEVVEEESKTALSFADQLDGQLFPVLQD